MLTECRALAPEWSQKLLALASQNARFPYNSVRSYAGPAIVTTAAALAQPAPVALRSGQPGVGPVVELPADVAALLGAFFAEALREDGAAATGAGAAMEIDGAEGDAAGSQRDHGLETAASAIVFAGYAGVSDILGAWLPGALRGMVEVAENKDKQVAATGKSALLYMAQTAYVVPGTVHRLVESLTSLALPGGLAEASGKVPETNWKEREVSLPLLLDVASRNVFVLPSPDSLATVEKVFDKSLSDPRHEVRSVASKCLATYLRATGFFSDTPGMEARAKRAITLVRKSDSPSTAPPDGSLPDPHPGRVLRLESLSLAYPYTVPPWMPVVLCELVRCAQGKAVRGNGQTVAGAKSTLGEWWRTHRETWGRDRSLFTEEQATMITEAVTTPSYYA